MRDYHNTAWRSKNPASAKLLAQYMSELSEKYYCAGWLHGLEYELWNAIKGNATNLFEESISNTEIACLSLLHSDADGWWYWLDNGINFGETFLTTEEWLIHLKNRGCTNESMD